MKYLLPILFIALISCSESTETTQVEQDNPFVELFGGSKPICPIGHHQDSIIDILYGMPTEESFAEADSGLIWLGGCELGEEQYYCKIHEFAF